MRRPSNNQITLGYGSSESPYTESNRHMGTDFSHSPDDLIYAPENGTVTFVGWMGTAGNAIEQVGADGRKWRFCHLASFNVFTGQTVSEGHVMGVMGETGYAFGRHLHLVLLVNGTRTDPMSVLPSVQKERQLMTPNFITRTYWLANGRNPNQDEINFHMANSNPESFVNGFGDFPLWRTQQDQLNNLQAKVNELNAALARQNELEAVEDQTEASVIAELSQAKERIASLTIELETARVAIAVSQLPAVESVAQPTVGPTVEPVLTKPADTTIKQPSWLTRLIMLLLRKRTR